MQKKLIRKPIIIASLVALTLISGYFLHNFVPRESTPSPAKQISQKPPTPIKASKQPTIQSADPPDEESTAVQVEQEVPGSIQTKEVPQAAPAAASPVEPPKIPITRNVEVSRSAPNTYTEGSVYSQVSKQQGSFGRFTYRDTSGGRIEIDPQWVKENIVTVVLPGLNRSVQVHKEAADSFITAFNYIKNGTAIIDGRQVPLLSLVKSMDGTFVSRHVNWNPSRGLSNHSWGIAIDINASDHFCFIDPSSDPGDANLILWEKAFKPAGFSWGNSYSDSMHYELLW